VIRDDAMIQTDIMVIGGGPAGMNAALAAAERGAQVLLVDKFQKLGGHWSSRHTSFWLAQRGAGTRGFNLAKQLAAQVNVKPNIKTLLGYEVVGAYPDQTYLAASWRIT